MRGAIPQPVNTMSTPSFLHTRRLAVLAALLLTLGLALPHGAAGQEPRQRINQRAVADSFGYRIATLNPSSGPIGTKVAVRWQFLPALTPVHLSLGALHVGFEVLKDILTDRNGEFTDTITIPEWAESTRPHALVVQDFYFSPLALSSDFLVTDKQGVLTRTGRLQPQTGKCAVLIGEDEDVYNLIGQVAGITPGERAIVHGRIAAAAECGGAKGVTIRITDIRRGLPG
jgi:hypothetical protein